MFFFRSLQRVLGNNDAEDSEDDTREDISSGSERTKVIKYDRSDDRSTISLRHFIRKLKIVRILSSAFGKPVCEGRLLIARELRRVFPNTPSGIIP